MISTISRRLFIAFACVVLLLVGQGLLTVLGQRFLMAEVGRQNQSCDEAQALLTLLQQTHTEVAIVVGSRNPEIMDEYRRRYLKDLERSQLLAATVGLDPGALLQLRASYDRAVELQYLFAFELAHLELARSLPLHDQVVRLVTQRLDSAEANKDRALQEARNRMLLQAVILCILALATACFWAWYLQRFFTDRRRAEATLAAALRRLESILDSATQVAIILTDPVGTIQVFNRGAEHLLGWRSEEVLGRETPLLWHDAKEIEDRSRELKAAGFVLNAPFDALVLLARNNQPERRKWRFHTRRGGVRSVDLVITRVDGIHGEIAGFLGIATDITQQEAAESALRLQEEQLRQSQKMDAIGQLAGGVAHDFNNMLAGILSSAELLAQDFQEEDRRSRLVKLIASASHRAADLTGKLLSFSRKGKVLSTPVDLHRIIQDALLLLQRSIDRRIELQLDLEAGSEPHVMGDPSQLENALLNIAINARDAMPEGGLLRIRTQTVDLDAAFCSSSSFPLVPGPFVKIVISDTGCGIPPEILDRIFEPFFTTKPVGKGTGLGLSAVYGIVKDHKGLLEVNSTPQVGTSFTIYLPLDSRTPAPASLPDDPHAHRGAGTILVIDDEDVVRSTLAMVLQSLGYDVILAQDGMEGLGLYETNAQNIQLVLLDMVMPGLSGKETFRRLRALDPSVRVIISSGFSSDLSITGLMEEGLRGFLHKPFGRSELMKALEAALAN